MFSLIIVALCAIALYMWFASQEKVQRIKPPKIGEKQKVFLSLDPKVVGFVRTKDLDFPDDENKHSYHDSKDYGFKIMVTVNKEYKLCRLYVSRGGKYDPYEVESQDEMIRTLAVLSHAESMAYMKRKKRQDKINNLL